MDEENNHHPPSNDPPLEPWVDPALEARIVALILGEASEFEEAELRSTIDSQPELKAFYDRILSTHQSLGRAEKPVDDEGWKLPTQKREALLELFRSDPEPAFPEPLTEISPGAKRRRLITRIAPFIGVAAAIILLLVAVDPLTLSDSMVTSKAAEAPEVRRSMRDDERKSRNNSGSEFGFKSESESEPTYAASASWAWGIDGGAAEGSNSNETATQMLADAFTGSVPLGERAGAANAPSSEDYSFSVASGPAELPATDAPTLGASGGGSRPSFGLGLPSGEPDSLADTGGARDLRGYDFREVDSESGQTKFFAKKTRNAQRYENGVDPEVTADWDEGLVADAKLPAHRQRLPQLQKQGQGGEVQKHKAGADMAWVDDGDGKKDDYFRSELAANDKLNRKFFAADGIITNANGNAPVVSTASEAPVSAEPVPEKAELAKNLPAATDDPFGEVADLAEVQVTREFIYPTEFDPPELPNSFASGGTVAAVPVTPANGSTFGNEGKPWAGRRITGMVADDSIAASGEQVDGFAVTGSGKPSESIIAGLGESEGESLDALYDSQYGGQAPAAGSGRSLFGRETVMEVPPARGQIVERFAKGFEDNDRDGEADRFDDGHGNHVAGIVVPDVNKNPALVDAEINGKADLSLLGTRLTAERGGIAGGGGFGGGGGGGDAGQVNLAQVEDQLKSSLVEAKEKVSEELGGEALASQSRSFATRSDAPVSGPSEPPAPDALELGFSGAADKWATFRGKAAQPGQGLAPADENGELSAPGGDASGKDATRLDFLSANDMPSEGQEDLQFGAADASELALKGAIVNREQARRVETVRRSEAELSEADELFAEKDLEGAISKYTDALEKLPKAPMTEEARERAASSLADATVQYAHQLAVNGRRAEARTRLETVLSSELAPDHAEAKKVLERIDDPEYYNQATTPEMAGDVAKVERNLRLATGYFDIGDLDKAEKRFNEVLKEDQDNEDARRGMEELELARQTYFESGRDHMRSKMLGQVDGLWEHAVPDVSGEPADRPADVTLNGGVDGSSWDLPRSSTKARLTDLRETPEETNHLDFDSDAVAFITPDGETDGAAAEIEVLERELGQRVEESREKMLALVEERGVLDLASLPQHWAREAEKLPDGQDGEGTVERQKFLLAKADYEQDKERLEKLRVRRSGLMRGEPQKSQADLSLETLTSDEPYSTISLNVSDVSFKLAKTALLENGTYPEPANVRVEEFVNAFDYGDPCPSLSEKVACQIDQAAHPFLQQRNLMRVSMRTAAEGRAASQPLRLTILLDKSGSMERSDREESVLRTMRALAKHLGPADTVTAIAFARQPHLITEKLSGDRAEELVNLVASTPSEGGTNLEEALKLADTLATRQFEETATNRIVLITDGAANLGDADPESLKERIIELRQRGIAFDACGVGADGFNDATLEALTRKGDGRYYFLNRPDDADEGFVRQLAGSLRPAAKNVKVQVKFNPGRVIRYRLAGFEKHRLKKEDFRNDKVDAAEMAAAEAGNALYQFEADPEGSGDVGEVFVRFLDTNTNRMVERSWPIPYQPKAPRLADAKASMQLAATAGLLAEKLKGGPAAETIDLAALAPITNALRSTKDQRIQDLIQMVEKARSLR